MDEYLDQGIKEVIRQFPPVGEILERYGIGCVPCMVGSCLLKDIIDIHDLSPDDERSLMAEIYGQIHPGRTPVAPTIERKPKPNRAPGCSPPIQKLVDEHVLILRVIALIPGIKKNLESGSDADRQIAADSLDFIRSFADRCHHAKEEDILLEYFDEGMEMIKTIREDHETGRAHVRAAAEALDRGDDEAVGEHLTAYAELLTEHITKEDGVLYPWMERNLTMTQVGELFARFSARDAEFGDAPKRYHALVDRLEQELIQKEAAR